MVSNVFNVTEKLNPHVFPFCFSVFFIFLPQKEKTVLGNENMLELEYGDDNRFFLEILENTCTHEPCTDIMETSFIFIVKSTCFLFLILFKRKTAVFRNRFDGQQMRD